MTSVSFQLELAIADVLKAKELAEFWKHPEEEIQRLDLIRRALVNVRSQLKPLGLQSIAHGESSTGSRTRQTQ